ncbi:MAG: hypothetical protein R3286_17560 [Gammaproteobacteria bacterium]|nr:hypothetical protein [Gammaproteobacteria bacterium]
MPRLFSFASWNIEHFAGDQTRFDRVVRFLNQAGPPDAANENGDSPPDVFSVQEVRSSAKVCMEFMTRMPSHQFFITIAPGSPLNILVAVNRRLTAYYEQRTELQSGMPSLRPGALVTFPIDGMNYSLLFLHLKAFDQPVGWGLRDDMIHHVRNLKKALDDVAGADARLIAMGDFNNVGLNVTFADNDMSDVEELARYDRVFASRRMSLVPKDRTGTLWNGPGSSQPPADADHAFASDQLDIRPGATGKGLRVRGWPELATDAEKAEWIRDFSDHALIYGEVHVS